MAIELDKLYSQTARAVRPSAIREMAKHAAQPGAISFARGDPAPEIFPVEEFYECARVLRDRGSEVLQYGNTAGYAPLADFLTGWLTPRLGRPVTREKLLITSGSGQVCYLLVRSTVDRGDFVIVEEPTFLGNTNGMRNAGANFITVPVDEQGMVVAALPEKIESVRARGGKISFIYVIPTFHNPAGVTMSVERRRQLHAGGRAVVRQAQQHRGLAGFIGLFAVIIIRPVVVDMVVRRQAAVVAQTRAGGQQQAEDQHQGGPAVRPSSHTSITSHHDTFIMNNVFSCRFLSFSE